MQKSNHRCELLIRPDMIPDRAGADTHVSVHIGLGQLLALPSGSAVKAAWLAGRAGEPDYLTGDDATTAACDALTIPVVTGYPERGSPGMECQSPKYGG